MSTPSEALKPSNELLVLTPAQRQAIDHLTHHLSTLLVAGTGAGKTAIGALTAQHYANHSSIQRVIIAAPPNVLDHWMKEARKWHVDTRRWCILSGTPMDRVKYLGSGRYNVFIISLANLHWITQQEHPSTAIIIDELSKVTGKASVGLRAKRTRQPFVVRIGMTATPVSEDYIKLFNMAKTLDLGDSLGKRKESYMHTYFTSTDYKGYNFKLKPFAATRIMEKVKYLVYVVGYIKADHVPAFVAEELSFQMSDDARRLYQQMSKDMLLPEHDVVAPNLAVASGKLRQITSGFVIGESGKPGEIDMNRAIAAAAWTKENTRKKVIVYEYDYSRYQLEVLLRQAGTSYRVASGETDTKAEIQAFITGGAEILLAQFKTLSHGVNGLQDVCHDMLMYQPIWSADANEQLIGRLHRQGQKEAVSVTYLVAEDSVDDLILARVDGKSVNMKTFMKFLGDNK